MKIFRALLILSALAATEADAAELKIFGSRVTKVMAGELAPQFEKATGFAPVVVADVAQVMKRRIEGGEPFDLAVLVDFQIDDLIKSGKLIPDSRADIMSSGIGVAVKRGAPKPDIGTVEAFRSALLNAKSVAHSAEGASGDYFRGLLARLGIAEQMKPKLRPMPADALAKAVPSGAAEMIVVTMSVIVAGAAELVGPVPAELQFYNRFAAGVGANAKQAEAAQGLLKVLTAPEAAAVIKAAGMVAGKP